MKKVILSVLGFVTFAIALVLLMYIKLSHDTQLFFIIPISAGLVVTMAAKPFIDSFFNAFVNTNPWKEKLYRLKKNKEISNKDLIYVSFSKQFRIMIDKKYFLPHSYRQNQYITLARSYLTDSEFREKARLLGATFCNTYAHGNDTIDFKFEVPANKLYKFMKLTETVYNKEFCKKFNNEALNQCFSYKEINMPNRDDIPIDIIGRYYDGVKFSRVDQKHTLIIYDICEVHLNDEQINVLKDFAKDPNNAGLFTANEIKRLGVIPDEKKFESNISSHCDKILIDTESKLFKIK